MQSFGRNRFGPKLLFFLGGGCAPLGGAGCPSNTMWPGPRPTCMPSLILIRPTVCPQYTNVTDRTGQTGETRQTRQRSDSIRRTVLQTVAEKRYTTVRQSHRQPSASSRILYRGHSMCCWHSTVHTIQQSSNVNFATTQRCLGFLVLQ